MSNDTNDTSNATSVREAAEQVLLLLVHRSVEVVVRREYLKANDEAEAQQDEENAKIAHLDEHVGTGCRDDPESVIDDDK